MKKKYKSYQVDMILKRPSKIHKHCKLFTLPAQTRFNLNLIRLNLNKINPICLLSPRTKFIILVDKTSKKFYD